MGDRVGVELLFNSVEFGSQSSCQQTSWEIETRCDRESHTRPRVPRKPPMEWTPTSGEQERHNVTVITVGSKYEVYVRSPAPSHRQPFRTLTNKVRGKYNCKEVFLRLPSFMRLNYGVAVMLHEHVNDYITIQCNHVEIIDRDTWPH